MASYYVRSGAGGSANGSSWANAYLTLAAAFSGKAAGDTFYVSEDHAETLGSTIILTSPGTRANPCKVICVNHSGSVPPVSADLRTTATISMTGASNRIAFDGLGTYYYGITFNVGSGAGIPQFTFNESSKSAMVFKSCAFVIVGTGSSSAVNIGNVGGNPSCYLEWDNCTLTTAATGNTINLNATFRWKNTASALLGTIPTRLFTFVGSNGAHLKIQGVDLSAAGSGKYIIGQNTTNMTGCVVELEDCKLNASVTLCEAIDNPGSIEVDAYRSGSSGVNYAYSRVRWAGTLTEETTIVRTGGASDGTTPLAWKIVTTANSSWSIPFESPPIAIWNDTTGSSVTATVEGIWGGGAVPNDDDIWIEVEYLGSSGSPLGSFVNDSKADILATAAGQTSSSETWGGSTTKFKMAASFTPQQKGWVLVRVKAAKASSTFYVCPKVALS